MEKNVLTGTHETGFEAFSSSIGAAKVSLDRLKLRGMGKYGLGGIHLLCMRQLYNSKEGLTRAELAGRLSVDRAQVTRIIGELLSGGFATESGGGSAYRKKCRLTEKGIVAIEDANSRVEKIVEFINSDITPEELEIFYTTLDKICDKLRVAEEMI